MDWDAARRLALARDGGLCQRCGLLAEDVHHRLLKGMGGTRDGNILYGPGNLVSLCRSCHSWVHQHPREGYATGFLVHSWDIPGDVPLRAGSHVKWLRPDGTAELECEYGF